MPDYPALMAEWEAMLGRRPALGEPLRFWTAILEGWAGWEPPAVLVPLILAPEECRQRWQGGRSLLADSVPEIPAASVEDLLGPVMERLAADGPDPRPPCSGSPRRGTTGDWTRRPCFPRLDRDPAHGAPRALGLGSHLGAFLPVAALRPALETFFGGVRELPDGVWTRGGCPWCGGAPAYGDLLEDGRRRLSCHLCGGAWIAARLRCPFCESWKSRDLVRLVAEELEEGYFIEACRACHGYLKGVDRRQRWNAGAPLVEDWASPHLDLYAAREGYWRATPSLAHLLPPAGPPGESPA